MRVGVVGGGVVGLATAWYLKDFGAEPVVVEAGGVGGGCSRGNNGWVCPSVSTPLPAPGLTAKSLLWMLRRASHFHIPAAALPRLAPWLLRFRSHCTADARAHGIAALASLNAVTEERYDELAEDGVEVRAGQVGHSLRLPRPGPPGREGEGDRGRGGEQRGFLGVSWTGARCYEMEPLLRSGFACGIHVETDRHVRPESLTAGPGRGAADRGHRDPRRGDGAGVRVGRARDALDRADFEVGVGWRDALADFEVGAGALSGEDRGCARL